jgi:hypothetical protein
MWVKSNPDTQFQLYRIGVHYDHVTTEAEMLVGDEHALSFEKDTERKVMMEIIEQFHYPLAELNLRLAYNGISQQWEEKWRLQQSKIETFKFASSLDVVLFINKAAAIFGRPPVEHLSKEVTRREVLVPIGHGKQGWINEGKWLADLALATTVEEQLLEAFGGLTKEGDSICLTLKPGEDVRGAARIYDSYGIAFLIPQPDRNNLREVCSKEKIPNGFTVIAEYRERIDVGKTALARSLAPYVTKVETKFQ